MRSRSHLRRIAVFLGLTAVLVAGGARAADTGNGSKNFRTPTSVPNYFSNEAGPMIGGAAESRRGELYMSQTYGTPRAVEAPAVAAPRARQRVAMAEPRGRLVRVHGVRFVAHHVTVHGRQVTRAAAHGSVRSHSSGRAAHVSGKATRVSSSHRHAHG